MSISLKAGTDGQSGTIQINGVDVVTINNSGIVSGVAVSSLPELHYTPTASVTANALLLGIGIGPDLAFRSTTLNSGTVSNIPVNSPLSLTVPSGATLGTVSAVQTRLVLLALNNAGTVQLGVINIAGSGNLDETNLVSTIAISSGATANNVIYSASALTNVAYRVLGFIDITEATAGTWATAPTVVQGVGGQALAALGSLGYSQQLLDYHASRAAGTTYYNTTGKPIFIAVSISSSIAGTIRCNINGSFNILGTSLQSSGSATVAVSCIIPPGSSYNVTVDTGSTSVSVWAELR